MMTSISNETQPQKYNVFSGMERSEIEGLTAFANMSKPSIPFRVNYENILVDSFYTGMSTDPREDFEDILAYGENIIDFAISEFKSKDSVTNTARHSWQIKTGFITINLCLHSFTEYDCGDDVFEDVAIHKVVVSMVAYYDTKKVYRSVSHSTDTFEGLNQFYLNLKTAMNEK